MGIINDYIKHKKKIKDLPKDQANDYWRELQRKNRMLDKELSKRFDYERNEGETFTQYKNRVKRQNAL